MTIVRQSQVLICLLVISSVIVVVPSRPIVLAANISCLPSIPCNGTKDNDLLTGTAQDDHMKGLSGDDELRGEAGNDVMNGGVGKDSLVGDDGNDRMSGEGGNDYLEARAGNDILNGGPGNDILLGDDEDGDVGVYGADVILGGPGDDKLFHSQYIESHGGQPLKSDGFKDSLDCGPGNDEAWINVNTDHDTVKNCETVHTEN